MQASSSSSFANDESARNTPGNRTNPLPLDFDQQLLGAHNHQPQQSQRQQQQPEQFTTLFPELDTTSSLAPPSDLDWLLTASADPQAPAAAPALDDFERELEQAIASAEPSTLNFLDNLNALDFTQQQFLYHRGAPTSLSHPGPLSAITASSESAYGDDRSELSYNPYSPQGSLVNAANPSHYNAALYQALENFSTNLAAFGLTDNAPTLDSIPPTQATRHLFNNQVQQPSVNIDSLMPSSIASAQSFSSIDESGASGHSPTNRRLSDEGVAEMEREFGKSTNLANVSGFPQVPPQSQTDPRKKYQCPSCPRAFARAFNLKTHMATHDPNRLKPFTCTHQGCGRSFSRKHDLGRHLVSIHKDESGMKMTNGAGSSASSVYGVSGHPLPHVAPANAGRVHTVGSSNTSATPHQKGSTTPTATANFLPNIALGSSNVNTSFSQLGSSFIKSEPKPLTIPGLNDLKNGSGVGVAASGVARGWCDTCGQGWVGQRRTCKCGGELDSKVKIKT